MIKDRFIEDYIKSLLDDKSQLQADIAKANFSSLYEVGRLQGQVTGLEKALRRLEELYEEQDN